MDSNIHLEQIVAGTSILAGLWYIFRSCVVQQNDVDAQELTHDAQVAAEIKRLEETTKAIREEAKRKVISSQQLIIEQISRYSQMENAALNKEKADLYGGVKLRLSGQLQKLSQVNYQPMTAFRSIAIDSPVATTSAQHAPLATNIHSTHLSGQLLFCGSSYSHDGPLSIAN